MAGKPNTGKLTRRWREIDWRKTDATIAKEFGVSRQAVWTFRRKIGERESEDKHSKAGPLRAWLREQPLPEMSVFELVAKAQEDGFEPVKSKSGEPTYDQVLKFRKLLANMGYWVRSGGIKKETRRYRWDLVPDWNLPIPVICGLTGAPPDQARQYRNTMNKRLNLSAKQFDMRVLPTRRRPTDLDIERILRYCEDDFRMPWQIYIYSELASDVIFALLKLLVRMGVLRKTKEGYKVRKASNGFSPNQFPRSRASRSEAAVRYAERNAAKTGRMET